MNRTRTIGSAIVGIALLTGAGAWLLSRHTGGTTVSTRSSSAQPATNAAPALHEEVARLQAEHTRLVDSLAAINKENTRLEKVKEQAEHAAQLFKELAAQSGALSQDPTNTYPTPRHVMAGLGKQARLMADLQGKWGDVDEDKLPPEEQKAMEQAMIVVASEMVRLQQAFEQMTDEEKDGFLKPTTPEAMADNVSCYLYGALELDAGQFSSINGLLQQYCEQAAQEQLLQAIPGEAAEAGTNRVTALNQLNENARAEIQRLLSPRQAAILNESRFKEFKFVSAKFYPPGLGMGFSVPTGN